MKYEYNGHLLEEERINLVVKEIVEKYPLVSVERAKEVAMLEGRIRAEVPMDYLPYLGPCVDFGMGDVCIEEAPDCFKFYVIDRGIKNESKEFQDVRDAIQRLISYYECFVYTDKLEEIFYQTLGLTKRDGMDMSASPIKK